MPFTIYEASLADAPGMAKIFLSDEEDEFQRLQRGDCSPEGLTEGLQDRAEISIKAPDQIVLVAKDDESGEVISYAQWTLPKNVEEKKREKTAEQMTEEEDEWLLKLPPGMNRKLMLEMRRKIRALQEQAWKGRPNYTLANVGTLPTYRRRGAASALVQWPFDRADTEGVILYLDTQDDNAKARPLYEKLGFVKVGEAVFDLREHGGSGLHTHIGMVREPKKL